MLTKKKLAEFSALNKIKVTAQISLAKDEIELAIANNFRITEIYKMLRQEKKLNCSYDSFRRVLKKSLEESATKMTGTTTIAKKAKPEEPEGFHPIDNPEDFRDELI